MCWSNWFHFVNKYVRDGLYRGNCTLHSILVSCPSNTYIGERNYYKIPPFFLNKGLKLSAVFHNESVSWARRRNMSGLPVRYMCGMCVGIDHQQFVSEIFFLHLIIFEFQVLRKLLECFNKQKSDVNSIRNERRTKNNESVIQNLRFLVRNFFKNDFFSVNQKSLFYTRKCKANEKDLKHRG